MSQQRRARTSLSNAPTSIEHGCFDTTALQDELAHALEEDRKYTLTDSMKKRAIHTAANYDEFKNLVACADLKPISQRELQDFSKAVRQTNLSFKKKSRKAYGEKLQFDTVKAKADQQPPETAVEFCRQWRRYLKTSDEKYRYLRLTTANKIGTMFKTDMDADLLADIVGVLLDQSTNDGSDTDPDSVAFALAMLDALTMAGRFSLILEFLDNNQVEKLRDLFAILETRLNNQDDTSGECTLETLRKKYKMV